MRRVVLCYAVMGSLASAALARAPLAATTSPAAVLTASPPTDWVEVAPSDLLVMDLQDGGRVVIALADAFAPVHIDNIRKLASAHWYDGLAIERVQDDYVTQWGDPDGKKPLPASVARTPPAEYERGARGVAFTALPYRDTFAPAVGASGPFPVAEGDGAAWLTHCYGMVGVGRDVNPDTGSGGELYAVIGEPIRALDRNIAVVGRVLSGMEYLAALPRGKGDMGFYTEPARRLAITRVRLGSDLEPAERPHLETLRPDSATYRAWVQARANRRDTFFLRPAGAVDICRALPPVRGPGA